MDLADDQASVVINKQKDKPKELEDKVVDPVRLLR
jgi:hypothetical protein